MGKLCGYRVRVRPVFADDDVAAVLLRGCVRLPGREVQPSCSFDVDSYRI